MDRPNIEPSELRAGLTWIWSRSWSDYPAGTWTLKYWLKTATQHIEITATASGDEHHVDVPASTTNDYVAGDYDGVATIESGATRYQVWAGRIRVLPRIDQAAAADLRSPERTLLDNLKAARVEWIADPTKVRAKEVWNAGRRFTFNTLEELDTAISRAEVRVQNEEAAQRLGGSIGGGNIQVRFG